jgi:hypothetical protein
MDEEIADTGSVDSSQAPVLEIGDQPSREFLDFFAKLDPNINGELVEKAWKQYDTTGQQIVLEVWSLFCIEFDKNPLRDLKNSSPLKSRTRSFLNIPWIN